MCEHGVPTGGSRQRRKLIAVLPKTERAFLADAQANADPGEFKSPAIIAGLMVLAAAAGADRAEEAEAQKG